MFSLLYVDDEPALLEIGQVFLEGTGEFTVRTVVSGREALDLLGRASFDAIISDYQMPEMDGIELLKAVRKTSGNIPFILFTGRGREEIVIEAINNGVDSYLQKGGDPRAQFVELAHRVRQAISRRKAETALSDSERRLADIINFLPDATFAIDTEGHVIAWNRAIEEMTGIPARNMLGKGNYEYAIAFYGSRRPILIDLLFDPGANIADYYINLRRDGNAISAETRLPHPKGKRIDILAKASPLYDRDGKISGAIEAIRDITERKQTEEILRKSEANLKRAEEIGRSGSWEIQLDENTVSASEGAQVLYGFEGSHLTIEEIQNVPLPEYRHLLDAALKDLIAGKSPYNLEFKIRRPADGAVLDIHSLAEYDPGRNVVFGIIRDITERKRTETELREAYEQITATEEELREKYEELSSAQAELRKRQQQMEEIAATVPGVVYQFYARPDGSMGFYYVSARAAEILGITTSVDEFFPAIVDRIHPEDRTRFMDSIRDVVKTAAPWDFTGRFIKPSGKTIWFRGMSSPVRHGDELVFSGVIQDITDKKHADLALLEERVFTDALLDSIPGLFYLYNDEGRLIRWNRNHEIVTGYSADELRGMHVLDWYKGDEKDTATIRAGVEKALQEGFADAEANLTIKSGKKIPFYFTAVLLEIGGKKYFTGIGIDLTSRKRAEAELILHQQQMTEIAATVPGVIVQFSAKPDGSTGIYFVSRRSEEIFGFDNSTAEYLRWFTDHLHADDRPRFLASLQDAVRAGTRWDFEGRFTRPSGEAIWFRGIASPVRHGDELVYSGVLLDITRQKHTEEILRESEEKYRSLVETTNTGYVILDETGKILDANPEYIRLTGHRDLSEITGRSVVEWTAKYDQEKNGAAIRQCFHDGFIRNFEVDYTDSAGHITPIEINATIVHENGKNRILTLCREITDRRKALTALHESEMKYRTLVENSNDIIYTIEAGGTITFVSPSWTALLGHPTDKVIGASFRQFIYPDDIPAWETFLASVVRSRARQTGIVYRVVHTDGSIHIHTSNISPVMDGKGTVFSYIGNARDITDMKRSENAIRESNRKLNLLNSITRHDLANQLTVVRGYTQLAMIRKPAPVVAEFLAKIDQAADVMARQIEFTRNYQDLGVQAPSWNNVADIVMAAKPQNIRLSCSCDNCEVFADPMIDKVFFNLFDNAVRHGGKVSEITVQCRLSSDELVITVEDNGIGVPLNEKQKIFDKGYGKHTGFGLFLVREILAITGIFIHETGAHGKGARFEIAVPKGEYRRAKRS